MLTVDSEELARVNYAGFSERKIRFIKETFVRFQHFEVSHKACDWDWIRMDGMMFGQPDYEYWIYKIGGGIKVQAEKKFGVSRDLFGIVMCRLADSTIDCLTYHTGHRSLSNEHDDNL
jgi:hypothetical protein